MTKRRAILTNPQNGIRLEVTELDDPQAGPSQALVRIAAFSLNRGEVRRTMSATESYIPGWDLAGIVEKSASDGTGPQAGTWVVGYMPGGAWTELAAVQSNALAALPSEVSFSQAACLPVAGLTALIALQKGGSLLGRRVLVTGASGGVGDFAVQLAYRAGATVVGITNHAEYTSMVRDCGAHEVVVGDPSDAARFGPYHVICDGVGGAQLSAVAEMLAPGGICVTYAAMLQPEISVNLRAIVQSPGASLTGLLVLGELRNEGASVGLSRLVPLVADGRLRPHIAFEAHPNQIVEVSQRLIDRQFPGKAVLLWN